MNREQVSAAAPPEPPCFADRSAWVEYLHSAQDSKKPPFRSGVFQRTFNFCNDCTLDHSARMERAGLCKPSVFVGPTTTPQKEAAHGR